MFPYAKKTQQLIRTNSQITPPEGLRIFINIKIYVMKVNDVQRIVQLIIPLHKSSS